MGIGHVVPSENVLLILGEVTKRERKVEFHQLLGDQVIGTVDEIVSDEGTRNLRIGSGNENGVIVILVPENTPCGATVDHQRWVDTLAKRLVGEDVVSVGFRKGTMLPVSPLIDE